MCQMVQVSNFSNTWIWSEMIYLRLQLAHLSRSPKLFFTTNFQACDSHPAANWAGWVLCILGAVVCRSPLPTT